MKKVFLSFVMACIAIGATAQISQTPIKTFDDDFEAGFVFDYSNGEQVIIRENNELLNIYDLSLNLKTVIDLTTIENFVQLRDLDFFQGKEQYGAASWLVSEKIFNNDELFELIVATTDGFAIVNENKVEIFRKSYVAPAGYELSWTGGFTLLQTKNGNMLSVLVEFHNGNQSYMRQEYYALPGYTTPSGIKSNVIQKIGNPFPNPAKTYIQLPYELPYGVKTGIIRVLNSQGRLIKTLRINGREEFEHLDTTDLPAGNYYFSLEISGQRGESKPFIVTK